MTRDIAHFIIKYPLIVTLLIGRYFWCHSAPLWNEGLEDNRRNQQGQRGSHFPSGGLWDRWWLVQSRARNELQALVTPLSLHHYHYNNHAHSNALCANSCDLKLLIETSFPPPSLKHSDCPVVYLSFISYCNAYTYHWICNNHGRYSSSSPSQLRGF